jgi:ornithine cyclodeaminase/alanine dehydrogenase-like protein (mu-crystallin family)
VIAALEGAFLKQAQGQAFNLPRQRLNKDETRLNFMLAGDMTLNRHAIRAYGSLGSKVSHIFLYGSEGLLAVIESRTLSSLRTGAASGVAAKYLAAPDARIVGIAGAGKQARFQLAALRAVRPLEEVRVFARTRAPLEEFCARMSSQLALPVMPAASGEAAAKGADIVVAATTAKEPVFFADWIKPGACVIGIGANNPGWRELDAGIITGAAMVVADDPEQARIESSDLAEAARTGAFDWSKLVSLAQVVAAPPHPTRGFTAFKSLGLGLEDLAAASLVYDEALKRGAGVTV